VEIIVAALLLALISAGMFSINLSSRKLTKRSQQRHFATEVAQTVLENLRGYLGADHWEDDESPLHPDSIGGWNQWSGWYVIEDDNFLNISDRFGTSEFATRYTGRWSYKIVAPGGNYEYRKVEVEVKWDDIEL